MGERKGPGLRGKVLGAAAVVVGLTVLPYLPFVQSADASHQSTTGNRGTTLEAHIDPPEFTSIDGKEPTKGITLKTLGATGENSPLWGKWSKASFRTPMPSYTLSSLNPTAANIKAVGPRPILQWKSTNNSLFYWEVQVSPLQDFGDNTWRWHNLVHGAVKHHEGEAQLTNIWFIPQELDAGTYYWRVRPRVQGDGTPAKWGPTWSFRVDPNKPSDAIVYAITFHDYTGNGRQNVGEPLVPDAQLRFKNSLTSAEFIFRTNNNSEYAGLVEQGVNAVRVTAIAPGSRESMNYIFPSLDDFYKANDDSRSYTLNIDSTVHQLLIGLGEGKNTMAFASYVRYKIRRGYELGPPPKGHTGIDYVFYDSNNRIVEGIEIYAAAPGQVERAGRLACEGETIPGMRVQLRHPDGSFTRYGHFSEINPNLRVGQRVSRGDLLGWSGNGGYPFCSGGPHLNFMTGVGPASVYDYRDYSDPNLHWTKKGIVGPFVR